MMPPIDLKEIRFNINHGGTRVSVNLSEVVAINEDDLSAEFMQQAALMGWWGTLAENAMHAYRLAEIELEALAAETSGRLRAKLSEGMPPGKKPTEDQLKEALKADPAYTVKRRAVEMARHNSDLLKSALRSVEEKGKMLQSYGAFRRAEMDMTGLRLLERKGGGK